METVNIKINGREYAVPKNSTILEAARYAGIDIPTDSRDKFYNYIFGRVTENATAGGPIAGCNFWGWAGSGRPRDLVWQSGDDYLCDPPHEPQGWYSVFDCDSSTINTIKRHSLKK